jgi:hypothetical protein
MAKVRKGICGTCGRECKLTPNGKVVVHRAPWGKSVCRGSKNDPEPE